MPETSRMDPLVHAQHHRSDQAQVLQLRAELINGKALYEEFAVEAENEARDFYDKKHFREKRVVLARFQKKDEWLPATIVKVHPPKVKHTDFLKSATDLSSSEDEEEDDPQQKAMREKVDRYISVHNPV